MSALTGWGRTQRSVARLVAAAGEDEVAEVLATARGGVIARGLGRSYGDAAQLAGGTVLDGRALAHLGELDTASGEVTVGAGCSIDELLERYVPSGHFVPVTPGTRQVTVGGAIAADVHGKNHHRDGAFCSHLASLRLVTPSGAITCSPEERAEVFWGTAGAMGLTGVVTEARLRLTAIETDRLLVDTDRLDDLDAVMAAMTSSGDAAYKYSVAWIDCMATGARLGRAVLTRANHARSDDLPERLRGVPLRAPRASPLRVPLVAPGGLLNALSVRAFNEVWFRRAPRHREGELVGIGSFFHPLDWVRDWNLLYGPRGVVQYQLAVPDDGGGAIRRCVELLSASGVPSFLGVLKRFGPADPGPMSFPIEGWTLALDMPVGPERLPEVLDELDAIVVDAGGRVYLAKDARLNPARLREMYPALDEFQALRRRLDPDDVLRSDLSVRLGLD
ncbi:MAG TPA: FAD-binding oxidoreductase [Acidimicrobiales bacterium]|nr:FAD-binding oxidoreductase [Acidimicrobiales bacterium]